MVVAWLLHSCCVEILEWEARFTDPMHTCAHESNILQHENQTRGSRLRGRPDSHPNCRVEGRLDSRQDGRPDGRLDGHLEDRPVAENVEFAHNRNQCGHPHRSGTRVLGTARILVTNK